MVYYSASLHVILCAVLFTDVAVHCAPINGRPLGFGSAKRAVIIGVDGLGGWHLRNVSQNYPAIRSFFDQGSYTTYARNVYPVSSGPNWSTYLTGMAVMEHGVFDNRWVIKNGDPDNETSYSIPPLTGRGRPLTIFNQVKKKDPNLQTAMMFTWNWLKYYSEQNKDVDSWYWGGQGVYCTPLFKFYCYKKMDSNSMYAAATNLIKSEPILTFIHLDALDQAGHSSCWGCPLYYNIMGHINKQIQYLIDALSKAQDSSGESMLNGTLLVIVSDHGGWRKMHGYGKPFRALVNIPILFRGPGVLKNNSLEHTHVSSLDVAVTVLNAIGVDRNKFMSGKVLEKIFE